MGFFKSLLFGPQTKAECRKAIADKKVVLAEARRRGWDKRSIDGIKVEIAKLEAKKAACKK